MEVHRIADRLNSRNHEDRRPPAWAEEEWAAVVSDLVSELLHYVADSAAGRGPVVGLRPLPEVLARLGVQRLLAEGGLDPAGFRDFLREYLALSTRLHHPAYLAHQVAAPDLPAALADILHGFMNNPMAIYEMGPAAAAIELAVVNWMLAKVGWRPEPVTAGAEGEHGAGVLTHGGSLANLTALLAARAAAAPTAWENGAPGDLAVLAPPGSHYSIARALSIMGLGGRAVRPLPVDDREVIRPDGLPLALDRLRAEGRRCMAVVANAGATATGLYDPLPEIGAFCRANGLWLHVDACHGASALLSPRYRQRLQGIEQADSIVWDAHKMLRTSSLCTAVLFRDACSFERAFHQEASYLFYGGQSAGVDLIARTVECTKAPLGLKLFLNLAWRGEQGLGEYVESRYALTREIYGLIRRRAGFECPFEPQSNILCFRYGDGDAQQVAIREHLLREGRFHLSSAVVGGRRYLRMTVMSPHTDLNTIAGLLDAIESTALQLSRQ